MASGGRDIETGIRCRDNGRRKTRMKLREKDEERRQRPQKCDRDARCSWQKEEKTRKNVFSLENICVCQKNVVLLHAFFRGMRENV